MFPPLRVVMAMVAIAVVIAACRHSPTAPSCTYTVSASPEAFGAEGGNGSLTINTRGGCAWNAQSSSDWVTLSGSRSGTGAATIAFTVAGNPAGVDRGTTIRVEGHVRRNAQMRFDGRQPKITAMSNAARNACQTIATARQSLAIAVRLARIACDDVIACS